MDNEILKRLRQAILKYDINKSGSLAKKTVEQKMDPLNILDEIIKTIR